MEKTKEELLAYLERMHNCVRDIALKYEDVQGRIQLCFEAISGFKNEKALPPLLAAMEGMAKAELWQVTEEVKCEVVALINTMGGEEVCK